MDEYQELIRLYESLNANNKKMVLSLMKAMKKIEEET